MKNSFVLIITGPPGVGKTTLAKIICRHNRCFYFSADKISKKLFPGSYKDTPKKVKETNKELLKKLKDYNKNNCIVVDSVFLDKDFIKKLKKVFGKHLIIKVIFPPIKTIIKRDKTRKCWTSGEEDIKRYYKKYKKLAETIGENNYIDNSNQTPEETAKFILSRF